MRDWRRLRIQSKDDNVALDDVVLRVVCEEEDVADVELRTHRGRTDDADGTVRGRERFFRRVP